MGGREEETEAGGGREGGDAGGGEGGGEGGGGGGGEGGGEGDGRVGIKDRGKGGEAKGVAEGDPTKLRNSSDSEEEGEEWEESLEKKGRDSSKVTSRETRIRRATGSQQRYPLRSES